MCSPEQSRANAQASTGPRTEAGKTASSQNARKHGLSARHVPLSPEERPVFDRLEAGLRAEVKPRGTLQELVFAELVVAAWKRHVVGTLLAEAASSTRELFSGEVSDRVRKLQRHKCDQDRAFNRALRQLIQLQTIARIHGLTMLKFEDTVPGFNRENYEGLADYAKVTKQSNLLNRNNQPSTAALRKKLEDEANRMASVFSNLSNIPQTMSQGAR
ncbi:MAG: hypothetical protein JNK48_23530 [Bryobacterales bacterium]|nr:hypothetical protein [Bryobacterales bacterium]